MFPVARKLNIGLVNWTLLWLMFFKILIQQIELNAKFLKRINIHSKFNYLNYKKQNYPLIKDNTDLIKKITRNKFNLIYLKKI